MTRRTVLLPALVTVAALATCAAALLAVSAEEAGAAFPGSNGAIVFENFGDWADPISLYSLDPATGSLTRVTDNDDTAFGAVHQDVNSDVSPDGARVAFLRHALWGGRDVGLFVANTDGTGGVTKLTDETTSGVSAPAWSPDERKVAFAARPTNGSGAPVGEPEVYVVDADGAHLKRITDNGLAEQGLSWSPDGTRIAFSTASPDLGGVHVMNADGTGERKVADGAPGHSWPDATQPDWSPDGTRLAFACGASSADLAICTADPDGASGSRRIAADRFGDDPGVKYVSDGSPSWSPDGTRIAFSRNVTFSDWSESRVYTMAADGSDLRRVEGPPYKWAVRPDWGPTPGSQPPPDGPPETSIFFGPSGTTGPFTSFDFVSSRPGAAFECSLDGAAFSPCEGPKRYESLPDGGHAFEVRATDATAGADPTPARLSWSVDARGPVGDVAINGGRARTRDRSVSLAPDATDPGSGVAEMRLRNGRGEWEAWRPYAPSAEWRLSRGEGKKTVLAQYRDGAGNASEVARDSIAYHR
ncbi:MAG: tolB protein precursor, periplasmic protein involved in the tonb-independent uptake of group A colicins [uncultured Rubrobacteraceae bacterium]|uniref:TolB protein, periplasmic protein involved in the tonb-independent uptake of group A colicins n=1 Tax=uncultured Rubrobacteraceae bacterium TaxID=349277 RepID=A0A6J4NKM2_9ACTN|nr:MAG: tolB protein precursor, periplasmic protein involved in the tonb-independent uptake of group A colicins [uncultured Rubrobacteraceae bacterium]